MIKSLERVIESKLMRALAAAEDASFIRRTCEERALELEHLRELKLVSKATQPELQWIDLKGVEKELEGIFEITSDGQRIRRKSDHFEPSVWTSNAGYQQICLNKHKYLIHRLIATTLIPNEDPENLRWVSRSLNRINRHYQKNIIITQDELSKIQDLRPLTSYNGHKVIRTFYSPSLKKIFLQKDPTYEELLPNKYGHVKVPIIEEKISRANFSHRKFFESQLS